MWKDFEWVEWFKRTSLPDYEGYRTIKPNHNLIEVWFVFILRDEIDKQENATMKE